MSYAALYKELAENFDNAINYNYASDTYVKNALNAVVDVSEDTQGELAKDIAISLVVLMNYAWIGVVDSPIKESDRQGNFGSNAFNSIRKAVFAINDFVIRREDIYGDLTDFVNGLPWDYGFVPTYWYQLSTDAGIDTSLWNNTYQYDLEFTVTANDTLTPKFIFSGTTIETLIDDIAQDDLVSGIEGSIVVTTGQTVKYRSKYSWTNITQIDLNGDNISGNISQLSDLTNLTNLSLYNTSVSGDINNLSNSTNLTTLRLESTSVSGNISSLSDLTGLTDLRLTSTSVSGDVSSLSGLISLTDLYLNNTTVTPDISCLDTQILMTTFEAKFCSWIESEMDECLCSLFTNEGSGDPGRDCTVDISGNVDPSATGEKCKEGLISAGWTVNTTH